MDIFSLIIMMITIGIIIISEVQKYLVEKGKIKKSCGLEKIEEFCDKHYKKIWVFFIIIFFISVVYKFGELPKAVSIDEVAGMYDAKNIAEYGVGRYIDSYPIYIPNFGGGQSALWCYMSVILIKIFGYSQTICRVPFLIMYIVAIISSYLLVSKSKNKLTTLLFIFLILICPWNIENTRRALDCNLYASMLMLSLFLMNRAKRKYQYFIAGISVGVTLYTYCLSWITLPIFLAAWAIYMLWIKKVKFSDLCVFAIPIAILATPLIYFLLLNYGLFTRTQFGPITIPKLFLFRSGEVSTQNVLEKGLTSLKVIFTDEGTIYPMIIPLFLIGYYYCLKQTFNNIKCKKYDVTSLITIAFTTIFIGLLIASVPTANKANALYIPMMYITSVGIIELFKDSKKLFILIIVLSCISFGYYEHYYYTKRAVSVERIALYDDISYHELVKKIESNELTSNMTKRVLIIKNEPDMYQAFITGMSPYDYNEKKVTKFYGDNYKVIKLENYYYYHVIYQIDDFLDNAFEQSNQIVIVSEPIAKAVETQSRGAEKYEKFEYQDLCIFVDKTVVNKVKDIIMK